jgi:hypothetical protein
MQNRQDREGTAGLALYGEWLRWSFLGFVSYNCGPHHIDVKTKASQIRKKPKTGVQPQCPEHLLRGSVGHTV